MTDSATGPRGSLDPPDLAAGDLAADLSHIESGPDGRPASRMVDVGGKPVTRRTASARAVIAFPEGMMAALLAGDGPKGPIEEVARVAGILAAKRTGDLIPMCHPLALDAVTVDFRPAESDRLEILTRASCTGPTGVEMEAMTAASVAALTIYDMTKAVAKGIRIEELQLVEKTGGKSGTWRVGDP